MRTKAARFRRFDAVEISTIVIGVIVTTAIAMMF